MNKKEELLNQLRELAEQIKAIGIPKSFEEIKRKEEFQKRYDELYNQYAMTPMELEPIEPTVEVHLRVDWISNGVTFKLGETSKYMDDGRACKIEYDGNGYPTAIVYTVQDREIPNTPCIVRVPIKTDNLKQLVVVKKELIEKEKIVEVPTIEKKTVKVEPQFIMRCKYCGSDLTVLLRQMLRSKCCPSCGRLLWDVLRYGINEESLKEQCEKPKPKRKSCHGS